MPPIRSINRWMHSSYGTSRYGMSSDESSTGCVVLRAHRVPEVFFYFLGWIRAARTGEGAEGLRQRS